MVETRSETLTQSGSSLPLYVIYSSLLGLSILCMVLIFLGLERQDSQSREYLTLTNEQRLLSSVLVTQAYAASQGKEEAFLRLKEGRDRFDAILKAQKEGDVSQGLKPLPSDLASAVEGIEKEWVQIRAAVDAILAAREPVLSISNVVPLLEGLIQPQLLEMSNFIAEALVGSNAPARQVFIATQQLWTGQQIESNLNRIISGGTGAAVAADRFTRSVARFGQVLRGMSEGGQNVDRITVAAAASKVNELRELFRSIETQSKSILDNASELFRVQNATQLIVTRSGPLSEACSNLITQYRQLIADGYHVPGLGKINRLYAYAFGIVAAILVILLGWQLYSDTRARLRESEERKRETEDQNRRNQEAILRLLDELGDLAEGDLTVQASVTEDITGAIADSVNYAIEALRDLVSTINYTSELMAAAAQDTRGVADRLARASDLQARQIESASATVMQMAQSMDDVSRKTASSAEVAEKSVRIAHEGGDRVRRTIQGMDVIREHIQETSKRIKRLGESSQEIGDIVALINDISDQTNILALNAAIQASSAGEAGRGFAVVADEVQRLAERSVNATKRIEALVKTIQADTNEAIISMEKSTTEVVNGANLAEKAGEALEEIEKVSADLAALITDVSKAATEVTEMASRVSTAMISINEITAQTSDSSATTASSIGKLNQLAQELQQSVAGFRLPEQPASTN